MAIKSGSGALKYPLPSMYQIGAQQSAAAASSGGSASASAYGTNRQFAANKMRVQADLANSAAEREFRARSQMEGQQFRAQQEFYDREHQAGAQLQQQDFMAGQQANRLASDFEQQQVQNDFTTQRDQSRFEMDQQAFEREVDAGIEGDLRSGKLELSPDAQKRLNQLEQGKSYANDPTGEFDPGQRDQFNQRYEEAKRAIYRTATAPKAPSATDRAAQNRTFYNQQTGDFSPTMQPGFQPGTVNERNEFQPIVDTSKADEKQRVEDQKRREAEQALNDEIYKEAKVLADDGEYGGDIGKARDAILEQRRSVGASAPEPAPAAPVSPIPQGPPNPATGYAPPGAAPGWQGAPQLGQPAATPQQSTMESILTGKSAAPTSQPTATPEAFNQQWAALKPGGSLLGPDGKLYVKK